MLKNYIDGSNLNYFRGKIVATEVVDSSAQYMKAAGLAQQGVIYYSKSGSSYTQVATEPNKTKVDGYYVVASSNIGSYTSSPSIAGMVSYVDKEIEELTAAFNATIDSKIGQAMAASY